MKAVVLQANNQFALEEVENPKLAHPDDVIVQVTATTICGSDVHAKHGVIPGILPGTIIGHEFVGEIVELGDSVHGYSVGDRVTGEGHVTCGICRNCRAGKRHLCDKAIGIGGGRDGAFADYMVLPASNLWP
ncbi:MAG: zinc-dependent alcohol dehydrogenase, partial [Thermodesulfobacteriota bacterium]